MLAGIGSPRPVYGLEANTAARSAFGCVAQNQIGIDVEAGSGTVAQSRHAIDIRRSAALDRNAIFNGLAVRGRAHDDDAAAAGGNVGLTLWLNRIEFLEMSPL